MASYVVKTELFEGPFDLLLHLVAQQKLDVGALSLIDLIDQYIAYLDEMADLDLDVASEFLLLAARLLEIKANALLPADQEYYGDEFDELSPSEMRDLLIARLITYKQFKNVAAQLAERQEAEAHMHARQAGLEPRYLGLMPDYLAGVTLHALALTCAELEFRREVFLLEAEHIAAVPLSVEEYTHSIWEQLHRRKRMEFSELFEADASPARIVVSFLAILELYKRGQVELVQADWFAPLEIKALSSRQAKKRGLMEEIDDYEY
ncbi:MAG: segregation/condensation protein A [Coriobacteriia bacterium]|nr:segregation/condensation protein A [Coriobacteriia bacterium]